MKNANHENPLTVEKLIEFLKQLPQDALIVGVEYDRQDTVHLCTTSDPFWLRCFKGDDLKNPIELDYGKTEGATMIVLEL